MKIAYHASKHRPDVTLDQPLWDSLKDLGHELYTPKQGDASSALKDFSGDATIIWRGNRLQLKHFAPYPKPRVLVWTDGIMPNSSAEDCFLKKSIRVLKGQSQELDAVAVYWKKLVPLFREILDIPVFELPHGTIPKFIPGEGDGVCFIGFQNRRRAVMIKHIEKKIGREVEWVGKIFDTYVNYMDGYFDILRRNAICLNLHQVEPYGGFEQRVWDAMSVRRLCISERMEDTDHLITAGKHYVEADQSEIVNVVKYYLDNKEEREKIALEGYKHGLGHTCTSRMEYLVEKIEELKND